MPDMADENSTVLRDLIDRLRHGDDRARRELLERARDRLPRIAATIFEQDSPTSRGRHDLERLLSEVWMRLVVALERSRPRAAWGFFGLVFYKVRQVLPNRVSRRRRSDARRRAGSFDASQPDTPAALDQADASNEPRRLAPVPEFREEIDKLPDNQRTVVELYDYRGYSRAEIAWTPNRHRKQVSRLWLAETRGLVRRPGGCDVPFC
jgi:RNA polymerase sigma factor (sigma-70 family)